MKKYFVPVLLVVSILLTLLAGCSAVKSLERDVQVVLEVNGEYYGTHTVNTFNNALVTQPAAPEGKMFLGWAVKEGGEPVSENLEVIRYNDIKAHLQDQQLSITLYAVFGDIPQRDLVIAWYAKSATSGLDQAAIDAFQDKLFAYLKTQGYDTDKMDILLRPYQGNVGDTCAQIRKDADVDIMLGWSSSSNLVETGGLTEGVDFLENIGKIAVGEKNRYVARKTETDLCKLVYAWIQSEYGADDPVVPPATQPGSKPTEGPAIPSKNLVIAWYAKTSTSGLDQTAMDAFKAKLEAYLLSQGYKLEEISVTLRPYDGKVGETCDAIKKDNDVDIMLGWAASSNLVETGGFVEGTDFLENVGKITVGAKARYVARKTNTDICKLVYAWIQSEYGEKTEVPPATEPVVPPTTQPVVPPAPKQELVIAWYAKTSTSGLDQATMDAFKAKLEAYLLSQGDKLGDVNIVLRPYDGKVGETCDAIKKDNDVDIMLGWAASSNLVETGGFVEGTDFLENVGKITVGAKARYAVRKTDTDLCKLVYAWIQSEYGEKTEVPPTTQPVVPPAPKQDIVIAWYAKTSTSGLDQATMDAFKAKLEAYLLSQGYRLEDVNIVLRPYDGKVGETCDAIKKDNDVDIMLGWSSSSNLVETGGFVEGTDFLENVGKIAVGDKARYAARKTDTDLCKLVYAWIQSEYMQAE